ACSSPRSLRDALPTSTANLERVGDEANKIARMVKSIIESGSARQLPTTELRIAADLASNLLRTALDAFARLDTGAALSILKDDRSEEHTSELQSREKL